MYLFCARGKPLALTIKNVIYELLFICLYFVSFITPKRSDLWVFGAWLGQKYGDNPKILMDYVQYKNNKISCYWITKDKKLFIELEKMGVNVYYYASLQGLIAQLRAGKAIFSHSIQSDFFAPCISRRTQRIQLWHGVPLKRIGYDGDFPRSKGLKLFVKNYLLRYRSDYIDLAFAQSERTAAIFCRAFNISRNRVLISGSPSTDSVLKLKDKKPKQDKIYILFAPTFRRGTWTDYDFFENYDLPLRDLDRHLEESNIVLGLRPHPVNRLPETRLREIEKLKNIRLDDADSLTEAIIKYHILITDFSGILFDFAALRRPVYFLPLNFDEYVKNERALYVDYESFIEGFKFEDWHDLVEKLPRLAENVTNNSFLPNERIFEYGIAYTDGNNCERIYNYLIANQNPVDHTSY